MPWLFCHMNDTPLCGSDLNRSSLYMFYTVITIRVLYGHHQELPSITFIMFLENIEDMFHVTNNVQ